MDPSSMASSATSLDMIIRGFWCLGVLGEGGYILWISNANLPFVWREHDVRREVFTELAEQQSTYRQPHTSNTEFSRHMCSASSSAPLPRPNDLSSNEICTGNSLRSPGLPVVCNPRRCKGFTEVFRHLNA